MASKSIAVIGGSGALGRGLISRFSKAAWSTVCIDFKPNKEATKQCTLDEEKHWIKNVEYVEKELKSQKIDMVVSTAGGWAGGKLGDLHDLKSFDNMISLNVHSAILASHVAVNFLNPGGILVLTGALAALQGTPDMYAYSMSKAATHQLVLDSAVSLEEKNSKAIGILPITIDTPTNRQFMKDADWSTWTTPEDIASKLFEWTVSGNSPSNGSLIAVETRQGNTAWNPIQQ